MNLRAIREKGGYSVVYNNVDLGTFEYGDDGYLYYCPKNPGCSWSVSAMRGVADLLDQMNEPWDKQVKQALGAKDELERVCETPVIYDTKIEMDRLLVLATKHCPKNHHDWDEIIKIARSHL